MPNIRPISDLRNYTDVLRDVSEGAPVFLTKNGRGKYAIVDLQDYEKTQATIRLMNELAKGRRSGETEGWLTPCLLYTSGLGSGRWGSTALPSVPALASAPSPGGGLLPHLFVSSAFV